MNCSGRSFGYSRSPRDIFRLTRAQIQPTKVITRNGYAKKGRGVDVGSRSSPQNNLAAVTIKRMVAKTPTRRTHVANSLGMLVSKKGGGPQGDTAGERRHAGREARRSAREEEAFADRKDEEARNDTIFAFPQELHGQ
jgi:hypothetical protein